MFFLTRNDIKATDVFPKDLPTKICANFTCKGRECTRDSCPYSHPRNARELSKDTIANGRGSGGKNVIFSNGPNSTSECSKLLY